MFEYIILTHNDIEIRSSLYEILSNLGYKITTVLSYKELMEALKKERPDYIILDPTIYNIPTEIVLEKIKAINENIKVIISQPGKNMSELTEGILKIIREKQYTPLPQKETQEPRLKINTLIVDDEIECTELVENYLSKKGYNVDAALTGEEAIFKIKTKKPDVVLLDIRLPGMDGIIVLKNIKDIDKSITVIMTSAIGDEEIIKEAIEFGANGYLVKPFNMSKLETMILSNAPNKSSLPPNLS